MSGLETAIRSALERSDRTKAEVRARIYQSARQALEQGLRKQGVNDPETVAEQRHRLEATIHAIEQEERERLKAQATVEPPVKVAAPPVTEAARPPAPAPRTVPTDDDSALSFGVGRDHAAADSHGAFDDVRAARDDRAAVHAPVADERGGLASLAAVADERPASRGKKRAKPAPKPRRRRGFFSRLFVFVVIISSMGIAAWWVYSTGLLLSDAERQTGVPPQQPTASAPDFAGDSQEPKTIDPQRGFSSAWIEIFKPGDAQKITAGANATVEVLGASDGQAMRIVSRSADADGAAIIQMSPDVLREMVGKTSTIAITVQPAREKPVQFAVSCAFDRLGGCSRHRFTANPERADLLFRVTLPDAVAPSAPGLLSINADMSGQGDGINIYSIRVLPGQ
ncbi:hypothetical protein H4S14_001116 [Agrobacterium vitis]|nr:hypothetical protein [Agrobacterium vitis]MBE1437385.1 hypothetical protein [Agrobacterium vitis]